MKAIFLNNQRINRFAFLGFVLFLCLICVIKTFAFDRKQALVYVEEWWDTDLDDNKETDHYNSPPYHDYSYEGGDCANFGSQVLMDSGIRFKSFGYGAGGTIPGAENLRQYLLNKLKATEYQYLHDSIREGDIVFWVNCDSSLDADHTLIVRQRIGDEAWVAAHTSDRPGTRTDITPPPAGPDPLKDDRISVAFPGLDLVYLHLPDSPIIKKLTLEQNSSVKYSAYQDPDRYAYNPVIDNSDYIGTGSLTVKIVFDTPMDTTFLPVVTFGQNAPYDAESFSSGYWVTNSTWTASAAIDASVTSGEYHISVTAKGEDGSELDKNEDLSSYEPGTDTLHRFTVDTTLPQITLKNKTTGETILGTQTSIKEIVAYAEDTGSGLKAFTVYNGDPDNGGTAVYSDPNAGYGQSHCYDQIPKLSTSTYYMVCEDKVGNKKTVSVEILLAQNGDWTRFGYDAANTGYNPETTVNADDLNLHWSTSAVVQIDEWTTAYGYISCIAVENRIYAVRQDGYLCCIDPDERKLEWTYNLGTGQLYDTNIYPCYSDGKIFIATYDNLFCLNAETGQLVWGGLGGANAVYYDGKVFTGNRCYSASDGQLVWQNALSGLIPRPGCVPAIGNGLVYFVTARYDLDNNEFNSLYALNAETGVEQWKLEEGWYEVDNPVTHLAEALRTDVNSYTSPVLGSGYVYIGVTWREVNEVNGSVVQKQGIYALDALAGPVLPDPAGPTPDLPPEPEWKNPCGNTQTAVALKGSKIYVAGDALTCLNAAGLTTLWQWHPSAIGESENIRNTAAPVFAGNAVYAQGMQSFSMFSLSESGEFIKKWAGDQVSLCAGKENLYSVVFYSAEDSIRIFGSGNAPPYIAGVSPAEANSSGGAEITVTGENFSEGVTAKVGNTAVTVQRINANTLTLTLPSLEPGIQSVEIINSDGKNKYKWNALNIIDTTPPAVPGKLSVNAGSGEVDLIWEAVSGAAGYNVYRAASPFVKINGALVTENIYTDNTVTNGIKYTYAVTSVDSLGNESEYQSAPLSATPKEEFFPPAAITTLEAYNVSADSGIARLEWTATGDDGYYGNISSGTYRIKQALLEGTSWYYEDYSFEISTDTAQGARQSRLITGLSKETSYYFRLWLADEWKNWSEVSNGATVFLSDEGSGPENTDTLVSKIEKILPDITKNIKAENLSQIEVYFNEAMAVAAGKEWKDALKVYDVLRSSYLAGDVSYSTDTKSVTFTGSFKENSEYRLEVNTNLTDADGFTFAGYSITFKTMMSAVSGGTIEKSEIVVSVPADALNCDGVLDVEKIVDLCVANAVYPLCSLEANRSYQIIICDEDNNEISGAFLSRPITIKVTYTELTSAPKAAIRAKQAVWKAPASEVNNSINMKTLRWYYYNPVTQKWEPVENCSNDGISGTITAAITKFGTYAIMGYAPTASLEDLSNYPNPFAAGRENTIIQYSLEADSEIHIAIYDLLGGLVKTFHFNRGETGKGQGNVLNQVQWDGRNGFGETVANGGYIMRIEIDDGTNKKVKTRKILVVK